MAADVICLSRMLGAGGEQVGRLAADALGFRYVDEEIITTAADERNFDPETLAEVEQRRSVLGRRLDDFVTGGMLAEELRSYIRKAVQDTAAAGQVVIVAHAASYPLKDTPGLLRVLITAPIESRLKAIAAEGDTDRANTRALTRSDKNRADYLKRFYRVDQEQPTDYDLTINTDRISPEKPPS